MYSVLIAEDELLVRMGLAGSVAWESLGLRIVAESSDGLVALEQYEQWKPDIVFTDIRMPGMDGLALIREIRRRDQRCEIIVITCIEDFKVLHAAMELGISGYLLKATMTQADILAAVHQAIANLSGRQGGADGAAGAVERPLFAEALRDYLVNGTLSFEQFESRCAREARLRTPPACLLCGFVSQKGGDGDLMRRSVQRMISERLEGVDALALSAGERLMFLLYEDDRARIEELEEAVRALQKYIETNLNARLRVFLCRLRDGYRQLPDAARACARWSGDRFFCEGPLIEIDEANRVVNGPFEAWIEQMRVEVWRLGYLPPSARTEYDGIIERLRASLGEGREQYEDALAELVMFLGHRFKRYSPEEYEMYRQFVGGASSLSQTLAAFNQLIKTAEPGGGAHHQEVGGVIGYMQAHPEQDITLPRVAAMVNLSPNYFSQLFKEETGMSFTEYLASIRLEYAKSLLRSGRMPLQEIVTRCGFSDTAYFCKFFKKRTGMSPGQWRKSK